MPNTATLALFLLYGTICTCQFLQPRKFLERILELHEQSNNVLTGGDSMKLNVDLSSAQAYPVRDDLFLRVFNKNNNVTLCETKLFDHVGAGSFPCSFSANDARLRNGANNLALEVFSNTNWKVYTTQEIPDIHYFNAVAYEGHYDNFIQNSENGPYSKKIVVVSVIAAILALLFHTGPVLILEKGRHIVVDVIGVQTVAFSRATGSFLSYAFAALSLGLSNGFVLSGVGLQFLYDIFSSGLESPYRMLLAALIYSKSSMSIGLQGGFAGLSGMFQFLFDIFSAGLASPFGMSVAGISSLFNSISYGSKNGMKNIKIFAITSTVFLGKFFSDISLFFGTFLKSFPNDFYSGFKTFSFGLYNFPKFSFMVLLASGQFLFDIFYAGLGSPCGMIVSGGKSIGTILSDGLKNTVSCVLAGGNTVSSCSAAAASTSLSAVYKSSVLLTSATNAGFRFIYYLTDRSAKNYDLFSTSMFQFFKSVPSSCLPAVIRSSYFLYDIFSSGLASPCGMVVSGCRSVRNVATHSAVCSSSALSTVLQTMLKTYKNAVTPCYRLLFGHSGVGGVVGQTGLVSLLSSFFSIMKNKASNVIFVDNDAGSDDMSGKGSKGGTGSRRGRGAGTGYGVGGKSQLRRAAPTYATTQPPRSIFSTVSRQSIYGIKPVKGKKHMRRKGVVAFGLLCALFFIPGGKLNMGNGEESSQKILTQPSNLKTSTSTPTSKSLITSNNFLKKSPKKNTISKSAAFKNLINNFIANRKSPENIPAGCPLRRAGFF